MRILRTRMPRRVFLRRLFDAAAAAAAARVFGAPRSAPAGPGEPVDLAEAGFRNLWLHHPCVGDASFDAFVRLSDNPIYRGASPFEWPVNGFLFEDPVSKGWYAYIGLYPRGYWPPGGCRLLRSKDKGVSWEDLGVVLSGSPTTFDGDGRAAGGTPDVSVCYADGAYHMVCDWANPDNSDGGLAYARGERPEGPFVRAAGPIHAESRQPLLLGKYKRVYAPTLLRRKNDWLILADMSTPRNVGGTWALVALTAAQPEGPYSEPRFLLSPQSGVFHPTPVEFYPCFEHRGEVFAPATSLGANRSFQTIFRAPLEEAHSPTAWRVERSGSVWHDEPVEWESKGIWGQTFSAFVDAAGSLNALFPSKDGRDCGTMSLARRDWRSADRDGFVLSAPNGPAASFLLREHGDFTLEAEVRSSGPWRLIWSHRGPVGANRIWHADGGPHALAFSDCTELSISLANWELRRRGRTGEASVLGRGELQPQAKLSGTPGQVSAPTGASPGLCSGLQRRVVNIRKSDAALTVAIGGRVVWSGEAPGGPGSIGFVAESPGILFVDKLLVSDAGKSRSLFLLATDAILGAGSGQDGWSEEKTEVYKFGMGFVSSAPGIRAKWSYRGRGFKLWSPRGPALGRARLSVDGRDRGEITLASPHDEPSRPIFEIPDLPPAYHAVTLTRTAGRIACDSLEIDPE